MVFPQKIEGPVPEFNRKRLRWPADYQSPVPVKQPNFVLPDLNTRNLFNSSSYFTNADDSSSDRCCHATENNKEKR
jgi:hypothetical protein